MNIVPVDNTAYKDKGVVSSNIKINFSNFYSCYLKYITGLIQTLNIILIDGTSKRTDVP